MLFAVLSATLALILDLLQAATRDDHEKTFVIVSCIGNCAGMSAPPPPGAPPLRLPSPHLLRPSLPSSLPPRTRTYQHHLALSVTNACRVVGVG